MRISKTNRFLTKTLQTLCCVGALTACSAWATVATWEKNAGGTLGTTQQTDFQTTSQVSFAPNQPDRSPLFASTQAPARANTELDEAMARTFDEEFVSVPSVRFATTAPGAQNVSVAGMSSTASGPGPMPVPEMSALFPIVGLIVAISCTQILRRRRVAQQTAPR